MTNIKMEIKGNELVLKVNLDETHGSSKSGKTDIIATTHGFIWKAYKDENIGISVNVNKK